MGATNSTPNYDLPQFIDSDKPTWRGDFNGAMDLIDSILKSKADVSQLPRLNDPHVLLREIDIVTNPNQTTTITFKSGETIA